MGRLSRLIGVASDANHKTAGPVGGTATSLGETASGWGERLGLPGIGEIGGR